MPRLGGIPSLAPLDIPHHQTPPFHLAKEAQGVAYEAGDFNKEVHFCISYVYAITLQQL